VAVARPSLKRSVAKSSAASRGQSVLEFFTCRTTAPIAIFQHVDQYAAGEYQAKGVDRAVAIAPKIVRA